MWNAAKIASIVEVRGVGIKLRRCLASKLPLMDIALCLKRRNGFRLKLSSAFYSSLILHLNQMKGKLGTLSSLIALYIC